MTTAAAVKIRRKTVQNNWVQFSSVKIYEDAQSTAQVTIIRTAKEHKYDIKQYKYTTIQAMYV